MPLCGWWGIFVKGVCVIYKNLLFVLVPPISELHGTDWDEDDSPDKLDVGRELLFNI